MNDKEKLQIEMQLLVALWNDNEPELFTVCEVETERMQNICDLLAECGFAPTKKEEILPPLNTSEITILQMPEFTTIFGHKVSGYIGAIKAYRDRTKLSLRNCKEIVDRTRKEYERTKEI